MNTHACMNGNTGSYPDVHAGTHICMVIHTHAEKPKEDHGKQVVLTHKEQNCPL